MEERWMKNYYLINYYSLFNLQYRLHGEAVVKAAVENGASHVDVSGEPAVCWSLISTFQMIDSVPRDDGDEVRRASQGEGSLRRRSLRVR